jgi:hypothetical protein
MNLSLYDPFREMTFSRHACFLCGTIVSDVEQIPAFPDWIQKRYGLAEKSLLLLDQSTITYGKMQIPCCPACQQKIQEVENKVEEAANKGLAGWESLEEKRLYLWLAKIFYGILTTELEAEKAPLIKPEHTVSENPKMLHKFQSFFMLLQALRLPIEFDDFTPSSIFILPLQREENTPEFGYRDDLNTMMFSLQVDDVLLVSCLLDNGFVKKALTPLLKEIEGKILQPIQAAELSARIYYAAYLYNLIPDYFPRATKPGDTELIYDSLVDDITMNIFNPWENSVYATALEKFWQPWQISREQILENPDQPLSFLLNEEGKFRELIA